MTRPQLIVQVVLFQAIWFLAALGFNWFGHDVWMLICLLFLLITLCWSPVHIRHIAIMLPVGIALGVLMDGLLTLSGIYSFTESRWSLPFDWLPLWLATMWVGFVTTLMGGVLWLLDKPRAFVLACALFGPLSYLAGAQLGIIIINLNWMPVVILAWAGWGYAVSRLWMVLSR